MLSPFSEFPFICILPLPNEHFRLHPPWIPQGSLAEEGREEKAPGTGKGNYGKGWLARGGRMLHHFAILPGGSHCGMGCSVMTFLCRSSA